MGVRIFAFKGARLWSTSRWFQLPLDEIPVCVGNLKTPSPLVDMRWPVPATPDRLPAAA